MQTFFDNKECELLVSINLLCIFKPEKCIKLPKNIETHKSQVNFRRKLF